MPVAVSLDHLPALPAELPTDALVAHILGAAKAGNHLFTDDELHALCRQFGAAAALPH